MCVQLKEEAFAQPLAFRLVPVERVVRLVDRSIPPEDGNAHASLPLPARIMALVSSHV
jgi:hypothetical protein